MCRMVPYYPYMDIALSIDEFSIDTQHIIDSITSDSKVVREPMLRLKPKHQKAGTEEEYGGISGIGVFN
ncbi:hypothetical protein DICVIV_01126, partial [Dictyocaulus viviparus]